MARGRLERDLQHRVGGSSAWPAEVQCPRKDRPECRRIFFLSCAVRSADLTRAAAIENATQWQLAAQLARAAEAIAHNATPSEEDALYRAGA